MIGGGQFKKRACEVVISIWNDKISLWHLDYQALIADY